MTSKSDHEKICLWNLQTFFYSQARYGDWTLILRSLLAHPEHIQIFTNNKSPSSPKWGRKRWYCPKQLLELTWLNVFCLCFMRTIRALDNKAIFSPDRCRQNSKNHLSYHRNLSNSSKYECGKVRIWKDFQVLIITRNVFPMPVH